MCDTGRRGSTRLRCAADGRDVGEGQAGSRGRDNGLHGSTGTSAHLLHASAGRRLVGRGTEAGWGMAHPGYSVTTAARRAGASEAVSRAATMDAESTMMEPLLPVAYVVSITVWVCVV